MLIGGLRNARMTSDADKAEAGAWVCFRLPRPLPLSPNNQSGGVVDTHDDGILNRVDSGDPMREFCDAYSNATRVIYRELPQSIQSPQPKEHAVYYQEVELGRNPENEAQEANRDSTCVFTKPGGRQRDGQSNRSNYGPPVHRNSNLGGDTCIEDPEAHKRNADHGQQQCRQEQDTGLGPDTKHPTAGTP
jgi:hypothetical protein